MSDFDLTTIYFILAESLGSWLWALLALALTLLVGIVWAVIALQKADRSAKRPLTAALVAGLVVTSIFTFLVPMWTLTGPGALSAPIDYAFSILFALVPGGMMAAIVFVLAARKCAAAGRAPLKSA